MSIWKSLTQQKWPLEDHHDALARVGLRFLFCTGPYFLFMILASAFTTRGDLNSWLTLWMVSIPVLGYGVDLCRLKKRDAGQSNAPLQQP